MRTVRGNLMVGLMLLLCGSAVAQGAGRIGGDSSAAPGAWRQLAKLTESSGVGYDEVGWSVAISKDGNTVAVGADSWCRKQGFDGCGQGAVFVFVKPTSGWSDMTETALLLASDGQPGDYLGTSVAISDDGSTIVAGAPEWPADGKSNGALYVFVRPLGGWRNATETARLVSTDGGGVDLGDSVGISGNTVAGGGKYFNGLQGAAYVFLKPQSGWRNMTQKARLTPSDGKGGFMGWSVAVKGDTVVAGAPITGTGGAGDGVYVFVRPKGGWKNKTETAKLSASRGTGFRLGYSVSIAGNTIVAGAPYWHSQDNGAAYVFVKPVKGWKGMTETARLTLPHSNDVGDVFGFSVAAEDQGKAIRVGCPGCLLGKGVAFSFAEPASGWKTTSMFSSKLVASDGVIGDRLGFSVSSSPAAIVAGAPYAAIGSNQKEGAAYVFGR
jgi:hypothetical protein